MTACALRGNKLPCDGCRRSLFQLATHAALDDDAEFASRVTLVEKIHASCILQNEKSFEKQGRERDAWDEAMFRPRVLIDAMRVLEPAEECGEG